jgi:peptidyl-prolyl cis-trans isomerase SurA
VKNLFRAQLSAGLLAAFFLPILGCNSQPGGDVMATVDGRKIFRTDVDKYYDNNVSSAQQAPSGEQSTALRLNILHQMIDDEILMRRAEKLGLLATEDEVDRKYNELKAPFTQEEFDKRLQDKKITQADFKRDIRRSAEENPDDRESPRQRRRLRYAGDEIFGRPRDFRQWWRPWNGAGIRIERNRPRHP